MNQRKIALSLAFITGLALAGLSGCKSEEKGRKVKSFDPKTGVAGGGDAVVIKGHGFRTEGVPGVKIYFGDKEGKNVRFRGDDTIVVDTPPGEAGTEVPVVLVFDDSGNIQLPVNFTYTQNPDALNVDALTTGAKNQPATPEPAAPANGE